MKKEHITNTYLGATSSTSLISVGATATGTLTYSAFDMFGRQQKNMFYRKEHLSEDEIQTKYSTTCVHKKKFAIEDVFKHGVYVLFNKNVVVYVGESINPYTRVISHMKDKKFDYFRVLYCKENRKKYWEKKLIESYRPRYNKTHKPKSYTNVMVVTT